MKIDSTIKVAFLYTIRYIVPILPHWILMKIADITGWIDNNSKKGTIIKRELRIMLGDELSDVELEAIGLESLRNFHKDLFEIWSFPKLTKKKLSNICYLTGQEYLDNALKQKKGAIIAVTHFGSWKILIPAIAYSGVPTMQVAVNPLSFINPKNGTVNNVIMKIEHRCEQSLPVKFLYINEYMRDIYRQLKNNGVVIFSFDGLERRREKHCRLFNMDVGLDTTPIDFAMRSRVPILPVFAVRQEDNRHRIMICPPLEIDYTLEKDIAMEKAFAQYVKILEERVEANPSHYARSLYVFATKWSHETNSAK